jgi:hypothetical protein
VAEGLVERIGAEIDKRVDARLAQGGQVYQAGQQRPMAPPAQADPSPRPAWVPVAMGLGSMVIGWGIAGRLLQGPSGHRPASEVVVLLIWALIAVINVAYARRP